MKIGKGNLGTNLAGLVESGRHRVRLSKFSELGQAIDEKVKGEAILIIFMFIF